MPAEPISIDTHPIIHITNDDEDNGIFFVLDEDSYDLPFLVNFKNQLTAAHPRDPYDCYSQLINRRHSPENCTLNLETYPDGNCNVLYQSIITNSIAISVYKTMEDNHVEIIHQGPYFN